MSDNKDHLGRNDRKDSHCNLIQTDGSADLDLMPIRVSQICLSVLAVVCESVTFWGFLSCVLADSQIPFFCFFVSQTRGELPASFHHFGGGSTTHS